MITNTITLGAVIILVTQAITLVTAGLSLWASRRNKVAIQEVHVSINSRMDELLKLTASASHAQGVVEGETNNIKK